MFAVGAIDGVRSGRRRNGATLTSRTCSFDGSLGLVAARFLPCLGWSARQPMSS
jgi:hypothetical protein